MRNPSAIWSQLRQLALAEADVVLYSVRITVWLRWLAALVAVSLLAYRPGFWYPEHVELALLQAPLFLFNGLAHYRLLSGRAVTWRWMLALSVMDVALITTNIAVYGEFHALMFVAYYPALVAFAMVFASPGLALAWATAVAAAYAGVSAGLGPGLDLAAGEEKALLARVAAMYVIALGVALVVRFERSTRQAALARERRAQQERADLSQEIHDTTAQTLYLIRVGVEVAMQRARQSDPALAERLAATVTLSQSALWELRRPIDLGHIIEGQELKGVLKSHTETFAAVTSLHAKFTHSGDEPSLTEEIRSGLFSIAHNALTNAFQHAEATKIAVSLDFESNRRLPFRR